MMIDARYAATEQATLPIFILGIAQRSGTNYLHDLLCLHPDCVSASVIWEDFVVAHADLLMKYTDSLYDHWRANLQIDTTLGPAKERVVRALGSGLIDVLESQIELDGVVAQHSNANGDEIALVETPRKRLVTKTPSVRNLQYFFKLFPQARLLIIVRDGRSVVESAMRSFNWSFEKATHEWAAAARTIIEFERNAAHQPNYMIVRYEDLYGADTRRQLEAILDFLDLDIAQYDFERALSLPVKGSSELRSNKGDKVHWQPVEKTQQFNPLQRWSNWSRSRHERFNWVAGASMAPLGYTPQTHSGGLVPWPVWNYLLDAKWQIRRLLAWGNHQIPRRYRWHSYR